MEFKKARAWQEDIVLPTYPVAPPDKNPLFLEKRVYQGSSGKVYPHPVTDKIGDKKEDRVYKALFLENDFLKIMILPELGGRVQRAYDKTIGYDFVYYNHVIKPALVGLAGPWISGGIEFNWPQHHRPSTFDPVNFTLRENDDGSATVICAELENMFHTKAETAFTLYPDKAYLELKNRLFNLTDTRQTFLWWANPAVAVNEHYRSIFPQDVTAVTDHGKRAISTFPVATGTYYKVDYSAGVDISRYQNLPVPTSYMAAKSDFDFVGGYDERVGAGLLHVADHQIAPGKKQWTWGSGDFGRAWDRNLTDGDGPYFELMVGCFTDNQPDFSFLAPMETRDFTQFFMPYHSLGTVHNACRDLSIRLDVGQTVTAAFYCSGELGDCSVTVRAGQRQLFSDTRAFHCGESISVETVNAGYRFEDISVTVEKDGEEILSFRGDFPKQAIPQPAAAAPDPSECRTIEDLLLYGRHIEQYRHATRRAEDYYREGLRRDPDDMRLNLAYGTLLLNKGYLSESEAYFRRALKKETRSNPNPMSGEGFYQLGVCLLRQDRILEAYDAFYKATWNSDTQTGAFYFLSAISARHRHYEKALSFAEQSLARNTRNVRALNLRAMLTRALGRDPAEALHSALDADPLNLTALWMAGGDISANITSPNLLIGLASEFACAGFYADAVSILDLDEDDFPLVRYYKAFYNSRAGLPFEEDLAGAFRANPDYCFPNRPDDIAVLRFACEHNKADNRAPYYLGNLYYDRERHEDAVACFERSISHGCDFATPYRNLALLTYNLLRDSRRAMKLMETAFAMDTTDARVLYELDLLKKKTGVPAAERLAFLECYPDQVNARDDLYLERVTLLNLLGRCCEALDMILARRFHPWEGGEGKVPEQYLFSNIALAVRSPALAVDYLRATYTYPESLGEGKLYGAQENRQNYYMGCALERCGKTEEARVYFENASRGISEPASALYYNDQPPETIFYQGLALSKLGRENEAAARFDSLISYADLHWNDHVIIDYFAVSLPDLLVFEDDLDRKNRLHCMFMKALGLFGQGKTDESRALFDQALSIDPCAFQIATHRQLLFSEERDEI